MRVFNTQQPRLPLQTHAKLEHEIDDDGGQLQQTNNEARPRLRLPPTSRGMAEDKSSGRTAMTMAVALFTYLCSKSTGQVQFTLKQGPDRIIISNRRVS